jgi:hypothetical protein
MTTVFIQVTEDGLYLNLENDQTYPTLRDAKRASGILKAPLFRRLFDGYFEYRVAVA